MRTLPGRLDTLRQEMARIATNLDRAYAALGQPPPQLDAGTVRLLHVSDLHLNPAGFDLAERLVTHFQVDAVVDTGDMGTWGLPFERAVPHRVAAFHVPYLFVKGNHDNDQVDHGTRELTDTTTGAAGPDGLRQPNPPPYGAEVVYLDAATHRPIAIDQITVRSLQAEFSVRRLMLPEGTAAFSPNPLPVPTPDAPRPGDETTVIEPPSTAPGATTATSA